MKNYFEDYFHEGVQLQVRDGNSSYTVISIEDNEEYLQIALSNVDMKKLHQLLESLIK